MEIPKYYIIELKEEVNSTWNGRKYKENERLMVWEQESLDCYWTVNTNDNFKTQCAKKLYEFEGKEMRID
jgi:hypothetical protein